MATLAFVFLLIPAFSFAKTPDDDLYSELWYLEKISAPSAWDIETGDEDIIVAVLDAGVDIDHPDLAENMWKNLGEVAGNGMDDDHNGYIDDVNGWDFVDNDNDSDPDISADADADAISHGSVISGIIGAVGDNGEGVVGVSWDVSIMPIRTLDAVGSGNSGTAVDAIEYAVANGARVINLSFSGNSEDPDLADAIKKAYDAGVVIVAAMGNEDLNSDDFPVYPACYGIDGENWVIGVASVDDLDHKSDFSNFGEDCVDISAPGEDIVGVNFYDPSEGFDVPYDGFWSGTSMAAPVVSGSVAILLSVYPDLTPEDVATILKLSVDPLSLSPTLRGKMGAGRINLSRALDIAGEFSAMSPGEELPVVEPVVSTVPVGSAITASTTQTVYYVPSAGVRRAFINESAFFTYYDSFDAVDVIADAELPTLSLGGLMLPKAGVVLVKIQSDPRVYATVENPDDAYSPILRAIESEEIAAEMYGAAWADYVIDIEPTFFSRFTQGEMITSPMPVDTSIMKTRAELAAAQ